MIAITVIMFFSGFYLIFMNIKMKTSGEIPSALVNKRINLSHSKDIPGYIKKMYPVNNAFGCLLSLLSGILVASEFIAMDNLFVILIELLFFAIIIVYAVIAVKTQNKYLL